MKKQKTGGKFTKDMSVLITKNLQSLADKACIRVRPVLRDELEKTHRANIYNSRIPAENGSYHYTGTLARHIKGIIDGDAVKTVIEEVKYKNDIRSEHAATLTTEVYEILKHGSKATPRKDSYPYQAKDGSMKWSSYIQQKPHDFEQRTLDDMEQYIDQELIPALTNKQGYLYKQLIQKYKNKRIRKE